MNVGLWAEIRRLAEIEKLSGRAIARRLRCSRHLVTVALRLDQPPARQVARCASLLDPHKAKINALVAKYPELSAVRVREEIARDGYTGSAIVVRRYLRTIRPARGRVYQEVHYEPAQAMQVDWGECGRVPVGATTRKVSVFVAVLCYSRLIYIEFTLSQRKAEFYRGIVNALNFFGGRPRAIIFDNLKAGVINGSGRSACFHPEFLALCGYFCLQPIACERRDPESKGVVEASVRYIKRNALAGRADELVRFEDYLAFAPCGVTRSPMCGSTKQPENDLWIASRKSDRCCVRCRRSASIPMRWCRRLSLPTRGSSSTAIVTRCHRPWHAGPSAFAPTVIEVRILHEGHLAAQHVRCYQRGQLIVLPDHRLAALALSRRSRSSALEQAFDALGPEARQFHLHLRKQPVKTGVHLRRLLGLARLYGTAELLGAILGLWS